MNLYEHVLKGDGPIYWFEGYTAGGMFAGRKFEGVTAFPELPENDDEVHAVGRIPLSHDDEELA